MLSYLGFLNKKHKNRPNLSRLQRQHLRLADQARDEKNWVEAAERYRFYLETVPSDAAIWTQLGHAQKEAGDLVGSENAYRTGLAFAPQDAELHLQLGHLFNLQGRLDEAERSYTRANELDVSLGAAADMESWVESQPLPVHRAEKFPATEATSAAEHRRQGDLSRDARVWKDACEHYQTYLTYRKDDFAIWVQYGHALKELGDPTKAETAYRTALRLAPDDADAHLHLGHSLKIQGKRDDAIQAYKASLEHQPTVWAIDELRASGYRVEFEHIPVRNDKSNCVFIEVSDLIAVMREYQTVSGIQRVQLGLLRYILSIDENKFQVVFWKDGLLWLISKEVLFEVVKLCNASMVTANRRGSIDTLLQKSNPVRPGRDDSFIITGAIWMRQNAVVDHEKVKREGTKLGAYIYDFIPLTHPEFCHPYLTERFSNTIAELMFQIDFAFTISDFVGREMHRLRTEAGYPLIPVKTISLAHKLEVISEISPQPGSVADLHGREFVLCVGSIAAHKNHFFGLQVWRLLIEQGIEPPLLVFAGKQGYGVDDLNAQLRTTHNLQGRVRIIEGLDDAALSYLYQNCLFTLFPSFVEGWGLPVGESLAYGKVCFASGTSSIPEVGSKFICTIDPYNVRSGADAITRILKNPKELSNLEAKIKAEFKPRSWDDFGAAFVEALNNINSQTMRLNGLQPLELIHPRPVPASWNNGVSLPTIDNFRVSFLSRTAFKSGWFPSEDWGCWMDGPRASLSIPTNRSSKARVRVILQLRSVFWPRQNRLSIAASGGETITVPVPNGACEFSVHLDCTLAADSRLELAFSLSGAVFAYCDEKRPLGIGLSKLLYVDLDEDSQQLPPGSLIEPRTLVGVSGAAARPRGRDALIEAARRRSPLLDGWLLPEVWGAWMDGPTAKFSIQSTAAEGEQVRVIVRLRSSTSRSSLLRLQVGDGEPSVTALQQGDLHQVFVGATGRVGRDGQLLMTLNVSSSTARVGLCAATWSRLSNMHDRAAAMEALAFGSTGPTTTDSDVISRDVGFTITGHLKGNYSLASVNRRLALAMDATLPGGVRVVQVEGHPTFDLDGLTRNEQLRLATLIKAAPRSTTGAQVVISQHWPLWCPRDAEDLVLAFVFWEESVVPRDMVKTLNTRFDGVLVPAQSVAKALLDSGVRIPVRHIGYAPDLTAFDRLGKSRLDRKPLTSDPEQLFTFLHVSSCFPRKGVDILIAAFAKAFNSSDPVRLIVKGFPNQHNDVAEQISLLRTVHSDTAPIEYIESELTTDELLDLYRAADTIVLPTRGEGFNIPAAEALAAGIPLIVTAFGAHTEFVSSEFARLVDFRFTYSRSHLKTANSVWAEPDVDDLALALREAAQAGQVQTDKFLCMREQAHLIGDGVLWANRVRTVVAELLSTQITPEPTVAWVSSWKIRCGIAEYSRMLLEKYRNAERLVTVLCDTRTEEIDLIGSGPLARREWHRIDPASVEGLASAIEQIDSSIVVIQHHHALIRWEDLAMLLDYGSLKMRRVVVTLHNTQEILDVDPPIREKLISSLSKLSRVLVHTIADLNLLKQQGLVSNVSLFPHGAICGNLPLRNARTLLPNDKVIVGAYGFFLPHKGFDRLIEAFAIVRRAFPKAILRLVTAEYPTIESAHTIDDCKKLSQSLGLRNSVEWHTEYLPNEKSLELLSGCDVIVLPYQQTPESSSAAVRSALAARVPVLVSPLAIFEELQGAVLRLTGMDVSSIASGVEWLLQSPSIREELVSKADFWLEENSWTNVADRLADFLQGLTADGSK